MYMLYMMCDISSLYRTSDQLVDSMHTPFALYYVVQTEVSHLVFIIAASNVDLF